MKYKKLPAAAFLVAVFLTLAAQPMKKVPFEVINKSGQNIQIEMWRYADDYPGQFYFFKIEEGDRKHPTTATWEVWKGDYTIIVFGDNTGECLLPGDIDDKDPGIEVTIKSKFRLVIPPCEEVYKNPGENTQLKYPWSKSFSYIEEIHQYVPYNNWFNKIAAKKK